MNIAIFTSLIDLFKYFKNFIDLLSAAYAPKLIIS